MNEPSADSELLAEFVTTRSRDAFSQLVARHVNLVYTAAMRQVRNRHTAEDITQIVFATLARKAAALVGEPVLPSWLLVTTRLTSLAVRRQEGRRQKREQKAAAMRPTTVPPDTGCDSEALSPLLDAALASLGHLDRHSVVLKFFSGASDREAAGLLGMSENALRQRRMRSLEKIRKYFRRHGLDVSASALSATIAATAVLDAPHHLAAAVTQYALAPAASGAASASAAASTAAALKGLLLMTWLKANSLVIPAVVLLLLCGTGLIVASHARSREPSILPADAGQSGAAPTAGAEPAVQAAKPQRFAPGEMIPALAYHTRQGGQEFPGGMGYLDAGTSLVYSNVDFGDRAGSFVARLAVPADHAGKQIVARIDRADGPVIARLTVRSTGGWGKLAAQSAALNPVAGSPVTGTHDVYLSFTGSGVANLYWIRFVPALESQRPAGPATTQPATIGDHLGMLLKMIPATAPARPSTRPGG